MSQYKASVPSDSLVKPEISKFFESFYQISDTSDAHEQYADQFTKDAKLIMGSKETSGRDGVSSFMIQTEIQDFVAVANLTKGIIQMRHGMWEKVSARSHKPAQIYAFGKSSDDVMLYGTVDYELKDGKKAEGIEWAARAHFSPLGGQPKMDFYQVYLDSAAMAAKAK